jgi:hypothetical protein
MIIIIVKTTWIIRLLYHIEMNIVHCNELMNSFLFIAHVPLGFHQARAKFSLLCQLVDEGSAWHSWLFPVAIFGCDAATPRCKCSCMSANSPSWEGLCQSRGLLFSFGGKSVRLNLVCIQLYIVYTIYSNFSITYHFEGTQFGPRTGRSFFQAFASAAKSSHFDPLYPMATWGWVDSCDICPPQNFGPQLAQLLSNVRMWFLCLGYLGQKTRVSCGFAQKWWYTPKGNHCNFR